MPDFRVPSDLLDVALDRLGAIGAAGQDMRDGIAILGLLACALDPQSWATSRKAGEIAGRLGLDLARWSTVIEQLERVGLVARVQHRGKKRLAIVPPGAAPIGRPRSYAATESGTRESV